MPLFEYRCEKCGEHKDHVVKASEKDDDRFCDCGGVQVRVLAPPVVGKTGYQMKAVLGGGARLKGHFGKDAKRDKAGRKK